MIVRIKRLIKGIKSLTRVSWKNLQSEYCNVVAAAELRLDPLCHIYHLEYISELCLQCLLSRVLYTVEIC